MSFQSWKCQQLPTIIYCFFQVTHQFWPTQHPAAATSPLQPSCELPFSGLLYTTYNLSTIFTLSHQVAEYQVQLFSVLQKLLCSVTCLHYPPTNLLSLSLPVLWERAVLLTQLRLHKEPEFTDKCSLPPVLITLHFFMLENTANVLGEVVPGYLRQQH